MARPILETVSLAGALLIAVPVAFAGAELFLAGDRIGGATLLGLAALVLVLERHLTTPGDVPAVVAGRLMAAAGIDPDGNGDENGSTDDRDDQAGD